MLDAPPPRRKRAAKAEAKAVEKPTSGPRFVAPQTMDFPEVRQELDQIKPQAGAIDFATRDGYELGSKVIQRCAKLRSAIESKRKELKEPALTWGRKVDGKAKELIGLVEDFEKPLRDRKLLEDRAEEARRKEAERKAREEEERRLHEARQASERAAREAAEERAKLEAERAKLEALQPKAPSNENAKAEPEGPPPRKAPADAPPLSTTRDGANWETLNRAVAQGCIVRVQLLGGAVQAVLDRGDKQWTGTGNTAHQALELAFERWGRPD